MTTASVAFRNGTFFAIIRCLRRLTMGDFILSVCFPPVVIWKAKLQR